MKEENNREISVDILKHLEDLSNKINTVMAERAKSVFLRYPVTFSLLILMGVIVLHEGLKGVLKKFGVLDIDPMYLLIAGLVILTITGTLYKKLDK